MTIEVSDFKPEYVGRGQWHVIHTIASKANTIEERRMVIWTVRTIVRNLRCLKCLQHATEYIEDHRIPENNSYELFRYLYEFHKAANTYAGKSSPSFEEIRKFYYENGERCSDECGATKK